MSTDSMNFETSNISKQYISTGGELRPTARYVPPHQRRAAAVTGGLVVPNPIGNNNHNHNRNDGWNTRRNNDFGYNNYQQPQQQTPFKPR